MSKDYAEQKIREALLAAGGNITLARQQVTVWASENPKLLYALARPHLNGIVAYQVERVASGRADAEKKRPPVMPSADKENKDQDFGMDILRAVADSHADIFGHESYSAPSKPGSVSKNHVDAIRQIAAGSGDGKKNPGSSG